VTYVIFFPPSPIKSIPSNTGRLYPSPNPHHLLNSLISIPSSSLGIITFYGYLKSFLPLKVGTCSGMLMGLIVAHLQLLSQPKMGLRSSLPTQLTFTGPCRINWSSGLLTQLSLKRCSPMSPDVPPQWGLQTRWHHGFFDCCLIIYWRGQWPAFSGQAKWAYQVLFLNYWLNRVLNHTYLLKNSLKSDIALYVNVY
jgi:hypothetical protein